MSERHGIIDTIVESLAPIHRDGHKFVAIAAGLALLVLPDLAAARLAARDRGALGRLLLPRSRPRDAVARWAHRRRRRRAHRRRRNRAAATGAGARSRASACASRPSSRSSTCTSRARQWQDVLRGRSMCRGHLLTPRSTRRARRTSAVPSIIARPDGVEIAVVQIAGLIARRIVAFVHEGDTVGAGERIGLIRFGSRVDVYLPPGKSALVCRRPAMQSAARRCLPICSRPSRSALRGGVDAECVSMLRGRRVTHRTWIRSFRGSKKRRAGAGACRCSATNRCRCACWCRISSRCSRSAPG